MLRHAAAPSLPRAYRRAIDGLPIGDGVVGVCGTAVALAVRCVSVEVRRDPRMDGFQELLAEHGIRAIWSEPLTNAAGEGLGTSALYRGELQDPPAAEVAAVAGVGSLAALAIERSHHERALDAATQLDPLTGLPIRARFLQQLTLHRADPARRVAVMFLDLDRYKWINDSLGHPAGDGILLEVGARLRQTLDGRHLIARFGGDEFTVLLIDTTPGEVERVAGEVQTAFTDPFLLDGAEFHLSVSIGIACDEGGATLDELVRDADAAMFAAKERGGGHRAWFDESLRRRVVARLTLGSEAAPRAGPTTSWWSITSRSSTWSTGAGRRPRRWCAGGTRPAASCGLTSSSRSPRRPI